MGVPKMRCKRGVEKPMNVSKTEIKRYYLKQMFCDDLIREITGYMLEKKFIPKIEREAFEKFMRQATTFHNAYLIGKMVERNQITAENFAD